MERILKAVAHRATESFAAADDLIQVLQNITRPILASVNTVTRIKGLARRDPIAAEAALYQFRAPAFRHDMRQAGAAFGDINNELLKIERELTAGKIRTRE
jgi:hypothetical protein